MIENLGFGHTQRKEDTSTLLKIIDGDKSASILT